MRKEITTFVWHLEVVLSDDKTPQIISGNELHATQKKRLELINLYWF